MIASKEIKSWFLRAIYQENFKFSNFCGDFLSCLNHGVVKLLLLNAPPYCNMQSPSQIISCSFDYFPAALCPVDVFRNREYNICI